MIQQLLIDGLAFQIENVCLSLKNGSKFWSTARYDWSCAKKRAFYNNGLQSLGISSTPYVSAWTDQ